MWLRAEGEGWRSRRSTADGFGFGEDDGSRGQIFAVHRSFWFWCQPINGYKIIQISKQEGSKILKNRSSVF